MIDPLNASIAISTSGLRVQSTRLRVVSENIANVDTAGKTPGADPFQRKTVTFTAILDPNTGAETVSIDKIGRDKSPFRLDIDPSHPAADTDGIVKKPNIDLVLEAADMREAVRNYEANLEAYKQARDMITTTIDLLRS